MNDHIFCGLSVDKSHLTRLFFWLKIEAYGHSNRASDSGGNIPNFVNAAAAFIIGLYFAPNFNRVKCQIPTHYNFF